jgi:phospholipid transport system substrate-binding protein
MKQSYSSKIDKYTDEKIVINSIKQSKKTRVLLDSSLVGVDDNTPVIYKYYKPKKQMKNKEKWLIYDVVIAGVSIIKTDKAQFRAFLKEHSVNELMDKLKK